MRHFRIAWPTVSAVVGCTSFLFIWIATQSAISGDIQHISLAYPYSSGTSDTGFYGDDGDDGDRDFSDGDYYYQQKYRYIYSQSQQPLGNETSVDVDADTVETEAEKTAREAIVDEADGPIDGTIPAEYGEETDSYVYQYEEVGDSEKSDSEAAGTQTSDTEVDDKETQDAQPRDTEAKDAPDIEVMDNDGYYDEFQDGEFPYEEAMDHNYYDYESQYPQGMDYEAPSEEFQSTEPQDPESIETEEADSQNTEAENTESRDTEAPDTETQDTEAMDYESMEYYESQEADSQNTTQSTEADGYGYTYTLPENTYNSSIDPATDIVDVEELIKLPSVDSSQYSDDQYAGSPYTTEYPGGFKNNERLALFTWNPAELLTWSDQETLQVLDMLPDQAAGMRRAVLSDYLESLGLAATSLANRFEKGSGLTVLALADDLAQTAAFLACFRLAERGELESDEALTLLQKSLLHRSDRWNRWIGQVTGDESDISTTDVATAADTLAGNTSAASPSAASPVLRAVVLTAAGSLERIGGAISGLSHQMKNLYR